VKRTGRKPGRPVATSTARLTAAIIVDRALALAQRLSLDEISVMRVAQELRVTPALIRYYLPGGRDALTSGVMNRFYREAIETWPAPLRGWQRNVPAVAHHLFGKFGKYPGVAAYFVSQNRFRIFQLVADDETDYGAVVIERFTGVVRAAPLDDAHAGIYAHLFLEFLAASAHTTARHRWPSDHRDFLSKKIEALDPKAFPNLHRTGKGLLHVDAGEALEEGLCIFLYGLSVRRPKRSAP